MYQHILIATDGSEMSMRALAHGLALAKSVGAKVTALTVTEPWGVGDMVTRAELGDKHPVGDYEAEAEARAMRILDAVRERAGAVGVPCQLVHEPDSRPSDAILRIGLAHGCDLIVLSTHAREGLARIVMGSQAAEVVAQAKVPVLVCR